MPCALTSLFDRWKDKYTTPLLRSILDQFDCKCLVENSFSWSIVILLGLKQVMVLHIHASHLRLWQTQLSNIALSCFNIYKTLY